MELQAEGRDFPGDAGRGRASMLDLDPETIVPSLCNCYEYFLLCNVVYEIRHTP